MKTNYLTQSVKSITLVVVSMLTVSNSILAQDAPKAQLMGYNPNSDYAKAEVSLNSINAAIEKTIKFTAPKVMDEIDYWYEKACSFTESWKEKACAEKSETIQFENVYQLINWLKEDFRNHVAALDESAKGIIVVSFVIGKDGKISEYSIEKSSNPEIDRLLINVIANAPTCRPLKMNGYPAKVKFELPVYYEKI